MAWNTPKVFTAEQTLTAAELNLFLRDNLLETGVAKATEAGQLLVSTGANSVGMFKPVSADADAAVTTSSTTPVTLGGGTPSVEIAEHSGACLILFSARMRTVAGPTGIDDMIECSPEVVGSITPALSRSVRSAGAGVVRWSGHVLHYGIPLGPTTIRLTYWVNDAAITGEFAHRNVTAIPL